MTSEHSQIVGGTRGFGKTDHQLKLLDDRIAEANEKIRLLEKLRGEVNALERRGNREQAFFAGRRSMAYELRESGGLASSRLGLEILYLLPDDFVQFYGSLFHRALSVSDSSVMHGRSGGVEKASGNTGTVTGSDTRLQASGTGKRFKNTPLLIGNEDLFKLKQRLDSELSKLTREYIGLQGLSHDELSRANGGKAAGPQPKCSNGSCRRFVKRDWQFCPACGTELWEKQGFVRDQR